MEKSQSFTWIEYPRLGTSLSSEGWLRAIDEALIVAHIGVANPSDTYEQAKP